MAKNLFSLSSYQFDLPSDLIAQHPCLPRDSSRLMLVDRSTGHISEIVFRDIYDLLNNGDSLIFNNTKVIPARVIGTRKCGGAAEILLLRRHADAAWDVAAKPGRKLQKGAVISFGKDLAGEVVAVFEDGSRRIRFDHQGDFAQLLEKYGQIPLPPYIRKGVGGQDDKMWYQTVYAATPGAVAAPTAGLHFTHELLAKLKDKGIDQNYVTLHVGLGTFKPVQTEDIRLHKIHSEEFYISSETAQALNICKERSRQVCVGTTSCRVLETVADETGSIRSGAYNTEIFIYPGYRFKYVRTLLTNFHLPGSSLLMLISAFAGYELMMEAYAKAIEKRFRFFSYGDSMLIL